MFEARLIEARLLTPRTALNKRGHNAGHFGPAVAAVGNRGPPAKLYNYNYRLFGTGTF
jgi:hypothetical protein